MCFFISKLGIMKAPIILIILISFIAFSCNKFGRINEISEKIEETLDGEELTVEIHKKNLITSPALIDFYTDRNFDQAWTTKEGLNPNGEELFKLIQDAQKFGLNPQWYHSQEINSVIDNKKPKVEELANVDILLTDAFMLFASHLSYGFLDQDKKWVVWKWEKMGRKGELPGVLQQAWEEGNIKKTLLELQPKWFEYVNLQKGLENFLETHELDNTKHPIPDVKTDSAAAYNGISKILVTLHLLDESKANSAETITESLKEFQKWHGIPADGVVGDYTRDALAMSTLDRYNQIAINLDRMRWDNVIPDRYVLVNIPAYHLKLVINNEAKEIFEVIVGTPDDQTPELIDNMTYIETFPYWNVPASIVNEEILPKIMENPSHMSALGYRIFDSNNNEIDPVSFDWSSFSTENFEYSIRQDGDSSNSLGLVKFMFPNKYNVYIHDTPSRHLFGKEMRSLSHGCIRINEPLKFADVILKADKNKYSAEDLREMIVQRQNRHVKLNDPKPVIIRYFTAEADENGNIYLFKDIYNKDQNLLSVVSSGNQMKLYSSK